MHLPSPSTATADLVDEGAHRATWAAGEPEQFWEGLVPVAEAVATTARLSPGTRVLSIDLPVTGQAATEASHNVEVHDWRHNTLTNLPYEDGAFDAVVSTFGHINSPYPDRVGAEIGRVLRTGGVFVTATWHNDGTMGRLFNVLQRYAPQVAGAENPLAWGRLAGIKQHIGPAGLSLVGSQVASVPFRSQTLDEAWRHVTTSYGPVVRALETGHGHRNKAFIDEVKAILKMGYRSDIGLVWNRDFILARCGKD